MNSTENNASEDVLSPFSLGDEVNAFSTLYEVHSKGTIVELDDDGRYTVVCDVPFLYNGRDIYCFTCKEEDIVKLTEIED